MIREARDSDLPELLRMGEAFASHLPFKSFNPERLTKLLRALMGGIGVIYVAERQGGLCGAVAMIAFDHYFCDGKAAQEFFWWVDPEYRRAGFAVDLIDAAEAWAKAQGCASVHMLCLDSLDGERVTRLYERRGYVPLERTFARFL